MGQSGGFSVRIEALSGSEHGAQDVEAASCERDEGLGMLFPPAPLPVVEGALEAIASHAGAEGALVGGVVEGLVPAKRTTPDGAAAGLAQYRGEACGGDEGVCGGEAPDIADAGDDLCCERRPHTRQRTDRGAVGVVGEQLFEGSVDAGSGLHGLGGGRTASPGPAALCWSH